MAYVLGDGRLAPTPHYFAFCTLDPQNPHPPKTTLTPVTLSAALLAVLVARVALGSSILSDQQRILPATAMSSLDGMDRSSTSEKQQQ